MNQFFNPAHYWEADPEEDGGNETPKLAFVYRGSEQGQNHPE